MPYSNQVDGLVEEVGGDETENIKKSLDYEAFKKSKWPFAQAMANRLFLVILASIHKNNLLL